MRSRAPASGRAAPAHATVPFHDSSPAISRLLRARAPGARRPGSGRRRRTELRRPSRAARCARSRCRRTARGSSPCNTPDDRLEVFEVTSGRSPARGSVPVGLEPVAVAARSDTEVWVVNHLSDSVSVVDVPRAAARRAHAAGRRRAARHRLRGPGPQPRLRHDGASRPASHPCFDRGRARRRRSAAHDAGHPARRSSGSSTPTNLGATLGGTPLRIVELFGDTPRALAVSPDGSRGLRRRLPLGQPQHHDQRGRCLRRLRPGDAPATSNGTDRRRAACRRRPPTSDGRAARPRRASSSSATPRATGATTSDATGAPRCASTCPTRTCSRSTRDTLAAGARLRGRRHDPLQHGREPGQREALRHQHRGAQPTCASRGRASSAAAPCRATSPRRASRCSRRRRRCAAAPEQAHRLRRARRRSRLRPGREGPQPRDAARDGVLERRRDALRRRLRLGPDRRLPHGGARGRHLRPGRASASYIPVPRRRAGGLVLDEARGRLYVLTRFDNAVSVIDLATRRRAPAPPAAQPGAGARSWRAGRFLYDARFTLEQRRGLLRALPHLRRPRQPRLGPRQPRRGGDDEPDPRRPCRNRHLPGADQRHRRRDDFHPMKGPMTTQTPARPGAPRRDALARRPRDRLLRRPTPFDEDALVRQLQRRLRRPARPRRRSRAPPRCRRSRTSRSRSRCRRTPSARSTTR